MIDIEKLLSELISIPSVNPMGLSVSGSIYFETALTDYLQAFFERIGLPWERQTVETGRDNIFARLDGAIPPDKGGRVIMFDAHQDTVQVDGMTIPPFTPTIKDGRIYGRGSCDTKGGMAAMLAALARLAEERPPSMPTIIMACSVNEELGATGAGAYKDFWNSEAQNIFPKPPDAAVIAEPTGLDVVTAHKGTVRWRCHTRGKAVHSSQPDLGISAIYRMARVLDALENYQEQVCPTLPEHPLCGRPTLSVGLIHGGVGINTVPDECTITIDRRVTPLESIDSAWQQVVDHTRNIIGDAFEVEHEDPFTTNQPLPDKSNASLGDSLLQCAQSVDPGSKFVGTPYATNAGGIASAGVPCVVFGPGSIDQAHTKDEWLALDQLHAASDIFYQFGKKGI